jgi:hypothetical protein
MSSAIKRIGQFALVSALVVLFVAAGLHWLTDSYTATRKWRQKHSTYSRSFWFPYRNGMMLADLLREHPELFDEALDRKVRLVRTDHSIAAHARNRISQAASAFAQHTAQKHLWDIAAGVNPRPIEVDYSLNTPDAGHLLLRPDDSIIIWTSSLPIYVELYSQ